MFTFIATLHVIIAVGLVLLVLVQDSKGGAGAGMFGGGSSQSILGATGAATLFQKMTTWLAVVFAITCMSLTVLVAHRSGSVLEGAEPPAAKAVPPTGAAGAAAATTTTTEKTIPPAGSTTGTVQAPAAGKPSTPGMSAGKADDAAAAKAPPAQPVNVPTKSDEKKK